MRKAGMQENTLQSVPYFLLSLEVQMQFASSGF
jgi:hypothetical protein